MQQAPTNLEFEFCFVVKVDFNAMEEETFRLYPFAFCDKANFRKLWGFC